MGKKAGGGKGKGAGGGEDAPGAGAASPAARPARPGLLDRLTWLVLVSFLVLLAVAHG